MTTYWISNFCILFNNLNIIPFSEDVNKNFNAIARLIIFFTVLLAIIFQDDSNYILIIGMISLMLSVMLYFIINRMTVENSRMYYDLDDPHNAIGFKTFNNITNTKKVTGLQNANYKSFYEITH